MNRLRALVVFAALLFLLQYAGFVKREGDFRGYFIASTRFLKRMNPYDPMANPTDASHFGMPAMPAVILMTALPSFFSLSTALRLWDFVCLLLWLASIFLWMELIWERPTNFPDFVAASAACMIAPLVWAFESHQVIIPEFFFITLACWTAIRRFSSFWTGLMTGCMLMKPHLVILLALALFFKSRRKLIFLLGAALGFLTPWLPFMNTVRPVSDLRTWAQTVDHYRREVYFADEQGLVARGLALMRTKLGGQDIRKAGDVPGIPLRAAVGTLLYRLKVLVWFLGGLLWAVWWTKGRPKAETLFYAITLAWGILISVYSHFYDGVLLTPLVLIALHSGSKHVALPILSGLFFVVNSLLAYGLTEIRYFHAMQWQWMGWACFFYSAVSIVVIARSREQTI